MQTLPRESNMQPVGHMDSGRPGHWVGSGAVIPSAQRPWISIDVHEPFAQRLGLSSTGGDGPPSCPPRGDGLPECLRPPHRSSFHTGHLVLRSTMA